MERKSGTWALGGAAIENGEAQSFRVAGAWRRVSQSARQVCPFSIISAGGGVAAADGFCAVWLAPAANLAPIDFGAAG